MSSTFGPARWPKQTEVARVKLSGKHWIWKPCKNCGVEFNTWRTYKVYCSKRCRIRAQNKRVRSTPEGLAEHREECRLWRVFDKARSGK